MAVSIKDILNLVDSLEKKNCESYERFSKKLGHQGLKNLIINIVAQHQEHCKRLEAFREEISLDRAFDAAESIDFRKWSSMPEVKSDMKNIDFLRYLMDREKALIEIYIALAGLSKVDEVKHFFIQLSEEEKKHFAWAKDRYDLESMLTS